MRKVFILITILIFIGGRCPSPEELNFERNPNLELLLTSSGTSSYASFFEPTFSSSQDRIFFINVNYINEDTWKVGLSCVYLSSPDTIYELVNDSVVTYAVSHNGNEIIFAKGGIIRYGNWESCELLSEQKLIRIDANTGNIIEEIEVTPLYIWHIEYLSNDSAIIFSGSDSPNFYSLSDTVNIYYLNLYTKEESLIISEAPTTFTLINDSVFYNFNFHYPQVNPVNSEEIIRLNFILNQRPDDEEDIILVDLSSQSETPLNVKPYYWTSIPYASWSPDGKKIVFSAAKPDFVGELIHIERFELWILNLD